MLEIAHNFGFLLSFVFRKRFQVKVGNQND
jgi:hypothetical protein